MVDGISGEVRHYPAPSRPTAPICSVCIANYNGVGLLDDCLGSVFAQQGGCDIEVIIQFLDFLDGYLESHFSYEEQCMENYRCPAHRQNRQAHEQFKQMFRRYKENSVREGFRIELLQDLNKTMHAWIQDHILRVDTTLKPCLKAARP